MVKFYLVHLYFQDERLSPLLATIIPGESLMIQVHGSFLEIQESQFDIDASVANGFEVP
jgi:hypothetical protein